MPRMRMSDATDKAKEIVLYDPGRKRRDEVGCAMANYIKALEGPMWECSTCGERVGGGLGFTCGHRYSADLHAKARRDFEEAIK